MAVSTVGIHHGKIIVTPTQVKVTFKPDDKKDESQTTTGSTPDKKVSIACERKSQGSNATQLQSSSLAATFSHTNHRLGSGKPVITPRKMAHQ